MIKKAWTWLVADDFKCPNLPDPLPRISLPAAVIAFFSTALVFTSTFIFWILLADYF